MQLSKTNKHSYACWGMVSAYSAVHFLVDFACAFLMFSFISGTPDSYLCVLLYNFFAFAFQMPLGIIADKCDKNHIFAAAGCALVCVAYGIQSFPVAAVVVLGIGNALFHIGAGIDVLNISEKKMSALGVFVSPGAFGVFFGTLLGSENSLTAIPYFRLTATPDLQLFSMSTVLLLALLAAAVVILIARKLNSMGYLPNTKFSLHSSVPRKTLLAVACFFFVVCIRSFMGLSLAPPWKSTATWGVVLVCAVVFGKATGGFLSDQFGAAKTAVTSLGIAALLFLFISIPIAGVAAVFLFNMTMPITLWYMTKVFPNAKGFSFGLLTFGLFIGFLPGYLGVDMPAAWLLALGAAMSLALLWLGLTSTKEKNNDA